MGRAGRAARVAAAAHAKAIEARTRDARQPELVVEVRRLIKPAVRQLNRMRWPGARPVAIPSTWTRGVKWRAGLRVAEGQVTGRRVPDVVYLLISGEFVVGINYELHAKDGRQLVPLEPVRWDHPSLLPHLSAIIESLTSIVNLAADEG